MVQYVTGVKKCVGWVVVEKYDKLSWEYESLQGKYMVYGKDIKQECLQEGIITFIVNFVKNN